MMKMSWYACSLVSCRITSGTCRVGAMPPARAGCVGSPARHGIGQLGTNRHQIAMQRQVQGPRRLHRDVATVATERLAERNQLGVEHRFAAGENDVIQTASQYATQHVVNRHVLDQSAATTCRACRRTNTVNCSPRWSHEDALSSGQEPFTLRRTIDLCDAHRVNCVGRRRTWFLVLRL